MAEATAKKLNRSGRSYSGKTRIPYNFMRLTTMRNGKECKLSASKLIAMAAIFSYSEGEKVAEFTARKLSEIYGISKSSSERFIKFALEAGLIKRLDKVSRYKCTLEKGADGFLIVEDWAKYAEFEFGNGEKDYLSLNEIKVLFYIVSYCRKMKAPPLWKDSYNSIARRLNIAANTVKAAVKRLKRAGLIRVSGRSWNGHTKMTFSVNEKALAEAKSEVIRRAKSMARQSKEENARNDYYKHLRSVEEERAEHMKEKALADEVYNQAVTELRKLDLEIAKAEVRKSDNLSRLLERQRTAQKQREERLAAMGLTDDDLRPLYHCTKCSDTGKLADGTYCDCYPAWRQRP